MENRWERHLANAVRLEPPLRVRLQGRDLGVALAISPMELVIESTLSEFQSLRSATGEDAIPLGISGLVLGPNPEPAPPFTLNLHPRLREKNGVNALWSAVAGKGAEQEALKELLTTVRKNQHIELSRNQDVEAKDRFTGFSEVSLLPEALPEMSEDDLATGVSFLGRRFSLPFFVTGMTGGVSSGEAINRRLAYAAQALDIPMGVGSQRIALEHPQHEKIFAVKQHAPKLFVIGNIGAVQLANGLGYDDCRRAVDMIQADALALHLNVLQEMIQVEGDRDFRGILKALEKVCGKLSVPVIVKEIGAGLSVATARRLLNAGVAAIDMGGKGGTSWSRIEGLRGAGQETRRLGETFRDWGIPTAYCLRALKQAFPKAVLTATGGIRDGLTVAKAVALGATMAGIGLPFFKAALISDEAIVDEMRTMARELKIAMMCSGARRVEDLRKRLILHPVPHELRARR